MSIEYLSLIGGVQVVVVLADSCFHLHLSLFPELFPQSFLPKHDYNRG